MPFRTRPILALPFAALSALPAMAQDATPPALPQQTAPTPPPLPQAPAISAWIEEDGAQGGPYDRAALEQRVADGTLTADTLAWMDGMADWAAAGTVPDLAPLFEASVTAAPAPRDTAAAAPADIGPDFLVGTWRQQAEVPMEGIGTGSADISVTLDADGSFTMAGDMTLTFQESMVLGIEASGTYTATPRGTDQIEVTLTGSVTMTPPPNIAPPETEPMEESTLYTVVDADTIRDSETGDTLTRVN